MSEIFQVDSSSFQVMDVTASFKAATGATIDLSLTTTTGSFKGEGSQLKNVTASFIADDTNITASTSKSSSYLKPGATFYIVSGSDGYPPAFIEPYDYSIGNYLPPYKEGRLWYDGKYNDYTQWQYNDTGSSTFRMHLGKEVTIGVHNPYSVTLPRLSVVYIGTSSIAGAHQPDVYLATADGLSGINSNPLGVIRSNIGSGSVGFCILQGVMHRTDVTPYDGDIGTVLYLSETTPGLLTTTRPGEQYDVIQIGYISELGTNGSFIVNVRPYPKPANAYAGMTSYPTITDDTASFNVYISSGSVNLYKNIDGSGAITQYSLLPITFSVPAGLNASFIYATTNGVTASYEITTNFNDINGTTKAFLATLYRADIDTHWLEADSEGLALANKLNIRLLETEKFAWESGFTLYATGSKHFIITEGSIWFGATNISQQEFDSRNTGSVNPAYETHFAYHSASVWTIPIVTDGTYNSDYYDNGTNLVPLGANSWSVNYFYRILGENPFDEDVFYLTSNTQYDNLASAQLDVLPSNIPSVLNDVSLLVGRMIIQSGSSTPTIESAFNTSFGQSLVTQHNSLAGLQGGIGGQFYHLTSDEYIGTGNGVFVKTDQPTLTNVNIASGTMIGSLTGTASVAINSISSSLANNSISSSYALSASWAPDIESPSSSWASSSISSSFAETSFYAISASWASSSISSSFAETSFYAISASWASGSVGNSTSASWASSSISSSYAELATNAITASYASSVGTSGFVFSKGGVFYDPTGITGTASLLQSVVIWRAPFACTASVIYGFKGGGLLNTTAAINVRKNGTLDLLTSSLIFTQSNAWVSSGIGGLQNQNFTSGDYMEILLQTASYYVNQIGVQVDLIRQ